VECLTEANAKTAFTREEHTAGGNALTTFGKENHTSPHGKDSAKLV
jgi:hypothetical protein